MNTFTIADAFSHGWKKTKEQFWLVALVLISYAIISIALSRVGEITKPYIILNIISFVVTLAIGVALRIGVTRFFLNADEDKGSYRDMLSTGSVYFTYFVAYIALSILTIVGLFILIIPGIIVALVYFFVPILIVDRQLEVIEAFKESAAITKGHRLHLLGFIGISMLVNFVGVLVLVVGLLITVPMTFFAGIYIYRRLLGAEIPMIVADPSVGI